MDPIRDAFAASIARAERTLRETRRSPQETPQERGQAVTRLSAERAKRRAQEAQQIAQDVRRLGLDADTLARVDAAARSYAQDPERWIFVMLGPKENAAVVRWLDENSQRPRKAVRLWATLLEHLRMDTGEITATRQELADRISVHPRELSKLMTELATINAVRREREGRRVRYFLNPAIATHLPGAQARAQARQEAGPLLRLMEGGKGRDGA